MSRKGNTLRQSAHLKTRLVLFDLDGVLLDSKDNMQAAWQDVQSQLGITTAFETYFAQIGQPFRDIMEILGLSERHEEASRIYFGATASHQSLLRWFPRAHEVLLALATDGVKLGIVTSKEGTRTRELLKALPVSFATIQTPVDGLRGKPAPDHLLVACAETNTDPGDALFIGDMLVDYQAAQRAGIAYAHAVWGYGKAPAPDCVRLTSMDGLLALAGKARAA